MAGASEAVAEISLLAFLIRSLIRSGVVESIDDKGANQLLDLLISKGETRTKVPVHQPFGFNSHAPVDGAVTHIIGIGGDPAHLIALPPSNPITARFGDLKEGESVLYDSIGQRLHLKEGKFCRLDAKEEFQVGLGANETILRVHKDGVDVNGNLSVSGKVQSQGAISTEDALTVRRDIISQGDVKSRDVSLQEHDHTTTEQGIPTTPPVTSGGATPPEKKPDNTGGDDKPKGKPTWEGDNGQLAGKEGNRSGVREMPPSETPKKSASDFVEETKEYLEKQGYVSQGTELKGRPGKEFESETFINGNGDKTTLNVRNGDVSSSKTGKETVTVDIHNNPEILKDYGEPNVKFKFPPKE